MAEKVRARVNGAFRTLALWLGLIALTVQGLAPLCFTGAANAAGVQSLVICTVHGFQTIHVDANGNPVPDAPGSGQDNSNCCTGCHLNTGMTVPVVASVAAPSVKPADKIVYAYADPEFLRFPFSYSSRAPPGAMESIIAA